MNLIRQKIVSYIAIVILKIFKLLRGNVYKKQIITIIKPYFENKQGIIVGDIGAGREYFFPIHIIRELNNVNKYYRVDISLEELTKANLPPSIKDKVINIVDDARILKSLENDYFDLVIVSNLLHHLPKKDRNRVFSRIYKVLKYQGYIVVLEILDVTNRFIPRFIHKLYEITEEGGGETGDPFVPSLIQLKKYLEDSGFVVVFENIYPTIVGEYGVIIGKKIRR